MWLAVSDEESFPPRQSRFFVANFSRPAVVRLAISRRVVFADGLELDSGSSRDGALVLAQSPNSIDVLAKRGRIPLVGWFVVNLLGLSFVSNSIVGLVLTTGRAAASLRD
jgi:hypothetical protein